MKESQVTSLVLFTPFATMDRSQNKRSNAWKHFVVENDKVKCKLCSVQLKKQEGTSNMRKKSLEVQAPSCH